MEFNVNKTELIAAIAETSGLKKSDVARVIDAFIEVVTKTLKSGGKVALIGFGSFLVTRRKATKGRDPRTGKEIPIPAKNQPKFSPGKQLKEAVNQ